MLDEPLAALDGMLKNRLRAELLEIQARYDIPMILITHDPDDLAACADVVVSLEAGRVIDLAAVKQSAPPPSAPVAPSSVNDLERRNADLIRHGRVIG